MHYDEIIATLQNLTGNKPKQREIADIIGVRTTVIGQRASRKSNFSVEDITKIGNYYNVDLIHKKRIQDYINNLASDYAETEIHKIVITPELKADLQKIYDEGIDLNWFILGKGNKYRASEFEQVKDELAQRMEKMENALKNAGILTD